MMLQRNAQALVGMEPTTFDPHMHCALPDYYQGKCRQYRWSMCIVYGGIQGIVLGYTG